MASLVSADLIGIVVGLLVTSNRLNQWGIVTRHITGQEVFDNGVFSGLNQSVFKGQPRLESVALRKQHYLPKSSTWCYTIDLEKHSPGCPHPSVNNVTVPPGGSLSKVIIHQHYWRQNWSKDGKGYMLGFISYCQSVGLISWYIQSQCTKSNSSTCNIWGNELLLILKT